jgi:hypothetical protein
MKTLFDEVVYKHIAVSNTWYRKIDGHWESKSSTGLWGRWSDVWTPMLDQELAKGRLYEDTV